MNNKNTIALTTILSALLIGVCGAFAHAKTVNAAKMPGFEASNATKALQAALDSGADKVIVPDVGQPWIVTPIQLRSNQTIVFKPGVVIEAKKGAFHGLNDSLFTARDIKNLKIIGTGAIWRMHKKDYDNPKKYKKSEWRMGLSIRGSTNITIKGLTIEKTGGDGIYIGTGKQDYSKNITIKNVKLLDNYRQGISVISVDGFLMENVLMANTSGTAPMAGIDFEPNDAANRLTNIVMRNCITKNNAGGGYNFYLVQLDQTSKPVSIKLENCKSIQDRASAVSITTLNDKTKAPKGKITFTNCQFSKSKGAGILISKPADTLDVIFKNSAIDHPAIDASYIAPIQITSRRTAKAPVGGVVFDQVTILDPKGRTPITYVAHSAYSGMKDVTGTLSLVSNQGTHQVKLSPELLAKWNPARDFADVPYIQLKAVKALGPIEQLSGIQKLPRRMVRKTATYALWAEKGDAVELKIHFGQIGNYGDSTMPVTITGPTGKTIHSVKVPFQKVTPVNFTASTTGLYRIKAVPRLNFISIQKSTNPISIVTPQKYIMLHKAAGTYYFWVPKGTDQFAIQGTGDGSEGFRMILKRPDGSTVQNIDNIAGLRQITVEPKNNQTGKIWTLQIKPSSDLYFGDQAIKLLGIPPLLAASPDAVIKSKLSK